MKRKNLIMVTNNYPFGHGEEFLLNEIEYLSKNFEKIFVISLNNNEIVTKRIPENFQIFSINFNKINLRNMFDLFLNIDYKILFLEKNKMKNINKLVSFQLKAADIEKKIIKIINDFDLKEDETTLYSYWFYEAAYAISRVKKKYKNMKAISRAHRYDIYEEINLQPFKKEMLKNLDFVLSCSEEGANYLNEKYKFFNFEYSYLGTSLLVNNIKDIEDTKLKTIVSCSYLRKVKRVELIIEALEEVQNKNKNIEWIHIGDGKEKEKLKKLAEKKLKIKYKFIGHLENEDVLKFYQTNKISCFINLSESEGLPVSMMEVQSFGIPIVGTNVGGVSEIINDKTGVLLEKNPKISDIALGVLKIIDDPNHEIMRKNCYDHWNKNFNAEKNYETFIKKYLLS